METLNLRPEMSVAGLKASADLFEAVTTVSTANGNKPIKKMGEIFSGNIRYFEIPP